MGPQPWVPCIENRQECGFTLYVLWNWHKPSQILWFCIALSIEYFLLWYFKSSYVECAIGRTSYIVVNWLLSAILQYCVWAMKHSVPKIKLVHQYCTKPYNLEWFMSISHIIWRKTKLVLNFLWILTFPFDL